MSTDRPTTADLAARFAAIAARFTEMAAAVAADPTLVDDDDFGAFVDAVTSLADDHPDFL